MSRNCGTHILIDSICERPLASIESLTFFRDINVLFWYMYNFYWFLIDWKHNQTYTFMCSPKLDFIFSHVLSQGCVLIERFLSCAAVASFWVIDNRLDLALVDQLELFFKNPGSIPSLYFFFHSVSFYV